MLKNKFIRDTVNKATFSEQCYYTFDPNISEGMFVLIILFPKKNHALKFFLVTNYRSWKNEFE